MPPGMVSLCAAAGDLGRQCGLLHRHLHTRAALVHGAIHVQSVVSTDSMDLPGPCPALSVLS